MTLRPDLVLRGGSVVAGGRVATADIAVAGGRISEIGDGLGEGTRTIDVSGAFVLPGAIDVHVHLNSDWPFPAERTPAEGFREGTRSAAAGGITTVIDFAYQHADRDLRASVDSAVRAADEESAVDFSFHPTVTEWRPGLRDEIPDLIERGFPSFKCYTWLPDFVANGAAYLALFEAVAAAGGMQLFHCEDAALLEWGRRRIVDERVSTPSAYGRSKPVAVEVAAIERTLRLAEAAGVRAYLVHVSAAEALRAIEHAHARGVDVFVETRPIYLHLTEERYDAPDHIAARYIGTPPLRSADDREALWAALADGSLDVVASDHVGLTLADKYRPSDTFETVPKGMANLETMLPMLVSEAVAERGLSITRVVEVLSETPARLFGMYPRKGTIAVASDADLVVFDPGGTRLLGPRPLHGAADFDVYEGTMVRGLPVLTVSRGEVIFEGGEVTARPGRGRLVARTPPSADVLRRVPSRAAVALPGGAA